MAETVIMDGATLSCAGVAALARGDAQVAVAPEGLARAAAAHRAALEAAARSPFYGRTTGVGANGMMAVDPGNGHGLRLVRSHVGAPGSWSTATSPAGCWRCGSTSSPSAARGQIRPGSRPPRSRSTRA